MSHYSELPDLPDCCQVCQPVPVFQSPPSPGAPNSPGPVSPSPLCSPLTRAPLGHPSWSLLTIQSSDHLGSPWGLGTLASPRLPGGPDTPEQGPVQPRSCLGLSRPHEQRTPPQAWVSVKLREGEQTARRRGMIAAFVGHTAWELQNHSSRVTFSPLFLLLLRTWKPAWESPKALTFEPGRGAVTLPDSLTPSDGSLAIPPCTACPRPALPLAALCSAFPPPLSFLGQLRAGSDCCPACSRCPSGVH